MQRDALVVVVLGTGGTIAGLAATANEHLNYRSAQLAVDELVESLPVEAGAVVETEQVAQLDSKDMDFATWRALAQRVAHHGARPEVGAIVITHGTDTLEETAYFLARVVAVAKPVVLTGAMRPASSLDADGPRNLADAMALARQAPWGGVSVVIAGQVHAPRDVRKVHPQGLDAFSSGESGVLAQISAAQIQILRDLPTAAETVGVDALPADPAEWPWVEIVTSDAGADGRVVGLLAGGGVDGIVVAGTGNGTIHHALASALAAARQAGVSVLRSSRCLDGCIADTASETLPSAGYLTPVKARIELILSLLAARGK
jgi:L-asparaginase